MKRKILISIICIISFLSFNINVSASSAKLVTTGPSSYVENPNIVNNDNFFSGTFQIGIKLTSIEGTAGISYLRIRIKYDTNALTNYGGAFYNIPNGMGWEPSAGLPSEYIYVGDANYVKGNKYLTDNINFYAVNFKPNKNIIGKTLIKFEIISAIDADGNNINIASPTHTISLESLNTDKEKDNNNINININNSNVSSSTKSNSQSNSNSQNNNKQKILKSSNNYLSNLNIGDYELDQKFDRDKFEYTILVSSEIMEVNINTIAEDSKSKIEITGNTNLEIGTNKVEIKVIAEDGSERKYILNIMKEIEKETSAEISDEKLVEADKKDNFLLKIIGILVGIILLICLIFVIAKFIKMKHR